MKALVLVLAISLAAIALPTAAEAHFSGCYDDDVPCMALCLAHAVTEEGEHGCYFRPHPGP